MCTLPVFTVSFHLFLARLTESGRIPEDPLSRECGRKAQLQNLTFPLIFNTLFFDFHEIQGNFSITRIIMIRFAAYFLISSKKPLARLNAQGTFLCTYSRARGFYRLAFAIFYYLLSEPTCKSRLFTYIYSRW